MSKAPKTTSRDPAGSAAVPPHRDGQTTPQSEAKRVGKTPHEHDESSASQQGQPTELMKKAHDDVERGVVDTSRAEVSDATYRRELRSEPQGNGARGSGNAADAGKDRRLDTSAAPLRSSDTAARPAAKRR